MIREIKKNDKFVCVRIPYNTIPFTVGKIYKSDIDGHLTDDNGTCDHGITAKWLDRFFIPYTYAAISAHYATLTDMDEADPFAMLLLDLEPTVERVHEACSCTEHKPNGIYSGTQPVREGLTRSEFLELEKVLYPELENQIKEGFVTREQLDKLDEKINWRNPTPTATVTESTQPNYYKFNINGTDCNMFDIGHALALSLELFSALKYFRVKGDVAKRINDLQKAKECIYLEIKRLGGSEA